MRHSEWLRHAVDALLLMPQWMLHADDREFSVSQLLYNSVRASPLVTYVQHWMLNQRHFIQPRSKEPGFDCFWHVGPVLAASADPTCMTLKDLLPALYASVWTKLKMRKEVA